jgi:glycosyltransferase involved in cell wall biosynthesis
VTLAFLNPSAVLGGAERCLLDVMGSLREAHPDAQLHLVVTATGPLVERARAAGVTVHVLPFPRSLGGLGEGAPDSGPVTRLRLLGRLVGAAPAALGYLRRLRRLLRRIGPDVVTTNGFKMHLLGSVACPRGVPLVWYLQDFVSKRRVMSRLLRLRAGRCATIVAASHSVADDVRGVVRGNLPVRTVYSAVDLRRFTPGGRALDLDAAAGLPPAASGTVRIGLLATLAWWKGHQVFLRAVASLPRDLSFRAYVIGGEIYETQGSQLRLDDLRADAARLKLGDRLGFTGFVEEPADAIRGLDVVVHASTEPEPFGLVIIEAMACARALVSSDAGGAAELVDDRQTALVHPPGDAVRLAAVLEELIRDEALRRRLGEAGRASVERRFDRRRLAEELMPIYRGLVEGR